MAPLASGATNRAINLRMACSPRGGGWRVFADWAWQGGRSSIAHRRMTVKAAFGGDINESGHSHTSWLANFCMDSTEQPPGIDAFAQCNSISPLLVHFIST
jgi:hypothetical protein